MRCQDSTQVSNIHSTHVWGGEEMKIAMDHKAIALTVAIFLWVCMYVKTKKKSILFKYVQFIVCELCLSKAGKKDSPLSETPVMSYVC